MSQTVERKSNSERTDLSDAMMLESAIRLIVEKGSDKTTLKEVGELAGYSRGLAGYRFGSKAGLFEFIVRSVGEQWVARLSKATKGKSGLDAIASALDEHATMCLEASDKIRAFYILWFESIGVQSKVKVVIHSIHERRRQDVVSWLKDSDLDESVSAQDIAGQFNASVLGIAYHWLANPQDHAGLLKLHQNLKHSMSHYFT
ncbi:MAG: TetR/AcrR family transcriptional regulator [Gammaproteobacteria bacterium]|nr:TetR/AcrR family transcriptional regulator [Gammaproteobacteria bacterium]NNC98220.1 TetR/AcrR family transcriptional regulator [Gammaproteobacteria bacterium]NNM14365.1 TetR/AcrR family transcriptional regulator [Gammaproteobacteria bacterium]